MQARSIAQRLQQATRGSAGPCAGGCAPPRCLQGGRACSPGRRAGRVRSPAASPRSPRPRASPHVSSQRDAGVQTEGESIDSIVEALQAKVAELQLENKRLKQLCGANTPKQRRSPMAAEGRLRGAAPVPMIFFPRPPGWWPLPDHRPGWWPLPDDPEPPEHTKPEKGPEPVGPRPGGPDWVREWMSPATSPLSEPDQQWPYQRAPVPLPAPQWAPAAAAGPRSVLPPPVPRPQAALRGGGARGVHCAAAAEALRSARSAAYVRGAAPQPQPPAPAAEGPPPQVGALGRLKAAWRRALGGRSRGGATPVTQQQKHEGGAQPPPQRATAAESAAAAGAPQNRAPAQPPAPAAGRGVFRSGWLRRTAGRL
eukprot:TRINITY_DN18746_c0_g3_i1.p1 TRINITY_DN18746_c0_g3~~TRINITY_DN18746_c0_g3_i1.p1  ORF type:complete len:399 (+),score=55.20 TRINITY_DN18746_c0_g3_i1:96-1199(+)